MISIDISEIWKGKQEDTVIYQSPVNGSCQTEYIPQCQILYFMNRSASFALRAHNIDQWAQNLIIFIHKYKFALLISLSMAFLLKYIGLSSSPYWISLNYDQHDLFPLSFNQQIVLRFERSIYQQADQIQLKSWLLT